MKLRNAHLAIVDRSKVLDYLLNEAHVISAGRRCKICQRDGTIGVLAGLELTPDDKALGSDFKVVNPVVGNLLSVDYNLVKTFNKRSHQNIRGCDVLGIDILDEQVNSRGRSFVAGKKYLSIRSAFIAIPRACQRSAA